MMKLKFSPENTKLKKLRLVPELSDYLANGRRIYSCDLLSGWNCPFAVDCLSKVITLDNGRRKIKDGPKTEFRCFSASQEASYPNVYNLRDHNADLLKAAGDWQEMANLIHNSLPKNLGICRIHVGGDFFNRDYFMAWLSVAAWHEDKLFYAYTKSLPYWVDNLDLYGNIKNMVLTASYGGRRDDLIESQNLRFAKVVYSVAEADRLGLAIDHDDSHAAVPAWRDNSFALLVHGIQPAGSAAGKAVKELNGLGSYSSKK